MTKLANKVIFLLSDNTIQLDQLRDIDGNYENSASVTATLFDSTGSEISGETWPINLTYVIGSNGTYRGVFRDSISIAEGDRVRATIIADAGVDKRSEWQCDFIVKFHLC